MTINRVTNTGNSLAGRIRSAQGLHSRSSARTEHRVGTCGATLVVGAGRTVNVVFTPAGTTAFTRTLTLAYAGAAVTGHADRQLTMRSRSNVLLGEIREQYFGEASRVRYSE